MTPTTITIIAMIAPVDSVMDSLSDPEAPASESPPTSLGFPSPGASPFPGCWGLALARAAKTLDTEAEDIAGVKDTDVEDVVGSDVWVAVFDGAMVVVCPVTNVIKRNPKI